MADSWDSGRLDRTEAILEQVGERLDKIATMGYLHDERMAHIEAVMQQMQEDERAYRAAQRLKDQEADERIERLVSAIGELVKR